MRPLMNSEYSLVAGPLNLTRRIFLDCKFFITESLEEYDRRAQQKYLTGQYIRRGQPGDLIFCPAAVYTHRDDVRPQG